MEVRELKTLLALMQEYGLVELEVEDKKGKVRLVRGGSHPGQGGNSALPAEVGKIVARAATTSASGAKIGDTRKSGAKDESAGALDLPPNQKLVSSPMVGTFYRASGPDAPPLVEEGDTVRKGQRLCIIEAMKMMNEIEAEAAGQVVRILCDNGQPVEYGQPLMILEATSGVKGDV
ncbi:MAG: acetyl-CoA carboxylase biotin carboxyl carrier protein [Candidatus Binataceae bacterium]